VPRRDRSLNSVRPALSELEGGPMSKSHANFTIEEARELGRKLGVDWGNSAFDAGQFRQGLDVELEHGKLDPETDVTHDDPILTAKIALAHLRELPDYYTRLAIMEKEADA
jgi:hypothetical protein